MVRVANEGGTFIEFIFSLFLCALAMDAASKNVQLGGFNLEVADQWMVERTAVGVKAEIPKTKDEVEFSPFRTPEGVQAEEADRGDEREEHYEVGFSLLLTWRQSLISLLVHTKKMVGIQQRHHNVSVLQVPN